MAQSAMSRRNFVAGAAACAGAAVAVVNGAVAVASEADQEQKPAAPVDGKYVTKAMGHEDWITVCTTFADGKIADCKVLSHDETMGVGNYACSRIPAAIVEHQSIEVPNVRGCSTSSMAIKAAVQDAIEQAGYNVEDFSAPIAREIEDEEVTKECDFVVMGAGTAGLPLAARLADKGYKVIVVEKKDIPGGSLPYTYCQLKTCGSARQDRYDFTGQFSESAYNYSFDNVKATLAAEVVDENDKYNREVPFSSTYYGMGGDCCDWLSEIGVGFCSLGNYEAGMQLGRSLTLAPGMYEGGSGYMAMFLADFIQKHDGCEIIYNATVNGLVQDESGRYVGVKAETTDSDTGKKTYTVTGKGVGLCAGGFAKNRDMLAEYCPEYVDMFFNCSSASTGDAIRLGLEAGSTMDCVGRLLPAYPAAYGSKFELAFMTFATPGILMNVNGDKCCNPNYHNHATMSQIKLDPANGETFYWIYDEASAEITKHYLGYGFNGYAAIFERECDAQHFDTVEEAAEALGLPNLPATLEQSNAYAAAGEKDEFGYGAPVIDTRTGLWATRLDPNHYLTTSGLLSDIDCHVLREDGSVIDGLYAAGDVCAAPEEKDGKAYAEGFSMAVYTGYALAETVAREIEL